jgi:eukaryotic-like serine/threonine-protein kinase
VLPHPPHPIDVVRAALPAGYDIVDYVDRGGQASVFDGTYTGQRAAIKVFNPSAEQERVDREIDALRAIDCDYLVEVLANTTITLLGQRVPVIAYEFLEGGDLRALLPPTAPARPGQATLRDIGLHVGTAIEALWSGQPGRRIVHRDIKPANIIRSGARNVLVDIGLARHLDLPTITIPGAAAGTRGYMSPEQAMGRRNLTIHSDVFSFGVTLYHLAAGVHPFNGQQAQIGVVTPVPLSRHRPDLTPDLCRLVDSMLAVVPHRRPTALAATFQQM